MWSWLTRRRWWTWLGSTGQVRPGSGQQAFWDAGREVFQALWAIVSVALIFFLLMTEHNSTWYGEYMRNWPSARFGQWLHNPFCWCLEPWWESRHVACSWHMHGVNVIYLREKKNHILILGKFLENIKRKGKTLFIAPPPQNNFC